MSPVTLAALKSLKNWLKERQSISFHDRLTISFPGKSPETRSWPRYSAWLNGRSLSPSWATVMLVAQEHRNVDRDNDICQAGQVNWDRLTSNRRNCRWSSWLLGSVIGIDWNIGWAKTLWSTSNWWTKNLSNMNSKRRNVKPTPTSQEWRQIPSAPSSKRTMQGVTSSKITRV